MRSIFLFFLISVTLLLTGCTNISSTTLIPKQQSPTFQSVDRSYATILQKGNTKESCVVCGMHLPISYKTNHASIMKNGAIRQYCSLHCLVYDNEINKLDLYDIQVVDTVTLKFVSAQSAYYVVGSNKPATMSHISKYAFAKRSNADAFVKDYGGIVMNFYDAYTIAMKDYVEGN